MTDAVAPPPADVADLERRLRADRSSRRPVLLSFLSAVLWLLVGSVVGLLASLQLHSPDLLTGAGWLTSGRMRPTHLNAMVYGWASLAMLGVSLWMIPRLVHTELRWPRLAEAGIWAWSLGALLGVGGILGGWTDGLEWLRCIATGPTPGW